MTLATVQSHVQRVSLDWVSAVALMILVVALWLPFGFNVGFVGDDWFFFLNAQAGIAWATLGRPLLPLAYVLGYSLAPGYFSGFNLLLLLLLYIRSWLTYILLRKLGITRAFAFAVAALVALCSADTGVFYLGALNVYFAWVAYLLALYLLIVYWQRPRLSVLVLMWCAQIINLGTYEAGYPLILLSPLILLRFPYHSRREWIGMLGLWYIFPLLNTARLIVLILVVPGSLSYQSGLMQQPVTIGAILTSLFNIYQRHLLSGWFGGEVEPVYWLPALLVGVLVALVCWWISRYETLQVTRFYAVLVAAGLVIIALGVAIYLPTALRDDTTRTYFVSSIGAALALAAAFRLVTRNRLIFAMLVGVFAAFGFAHLLEQHAGFRENSEAQQKILVKLSTDIPFIASNSVLLVMDETPERELDQRFSGRWSFQSPFLLTYGDNSLLVGLCYPDDIPQNPSAYCAFQDGGVEVRISPQIVWTRPYDLVILVRYTADHEFVLASDLAPYGHSSAYKPDARINFDSPPPEVVRRMFTAHNDLDLGISTPRQ